MRRNEQSRCERDPIQSLLKLDPFTIDELAALNKTGSNNTITLKEALPFMSEGTVVKTGASGTQTGTVSKSQPQTFSKAVSSFSPSAIGLSTGGVKSAICETAVAGLLYSGLPPSLAPAAYNLCLEHLPSLKGYLGNKAKELGIYAYKKLKQLHPTMKLNKQAKNRGRAGYNVIAAAPGTTISHSAAPVSISRQIKKNTQPRMRVRGSNFIIAHNEMLSAVVSGAPTSNVTAFNVKTFRCNPGISEIFPWLSAMAVNYEKYIIRRLSFTAVPLVSTAYSGRIGLGFDYDSTDAAPGSRQEFYALTNHVENMPWESCTLVVKTDNVPRFTGTHSVADSKLIDVGQLIVMSDNISNGGTISAAIPLFDLICDYEVELLEPQQALFSTQVVLGHVGFSAGATLSPTTQNFYGPQIADSIVVTSGKVITLTLPAGAYWVDHYAQWSTGTETSYAIAVTNNSSSQVSGARTFFGASFVQGTFAVKSDGGFSVTLTNAVLDYTSNCTHFGLSISRVPATIGNLAQD